MCVCRRQLVNKFESFACVVWRAQLLPRVRSYARGAYGAQPQQVVRIYSRVGWRGIIPKERTMLLSCWLVMHNFLKVYKVMHPWLVVHNSQIRFKVMHLGVCGA